MIVEERKHEKPIRNRKMVFEEERKTERKKGEEESINERLAPYVRRNEKSHIRQPKLQPCALPKEPRKSLRVPQKTELLTPTSLLAFQTSSSNNHHLSTSSKDLQAHTHFSRITCFPDSVGRRDYRFQCHFGRSETGSEMVVFAASALHFVDAAFFLSWAVTYPFSTTTEDGRWLDKRWLFFHLWILGC